MVASALGVMYPDPAESEEAGTPTNILTLLFGEEDAHDCQVA